MKLDIDTPSIEQPFVELLFEDDTVNKFVDHFYFEHHVRMYEMVRWWAGPDWKDLKKVSGLDASLKLMNGLRKKGVATHYWV